VTTLVTGAAGFAGAHLVEALAGTGDVVAWTRTREPADTIRRLAVWQRVDLLDRETVQDVIGRLKPGRVYHCAGSAAVAHSWEDSVTPLRSNVLATHLLLDALRRTGSRARVVIPGSATIYAPSTAPLTEDSPVRPANPYAWSKLAQEQLGLMVGRDDGLEVIVARSFNHTGPGQRGEFAATSFARQIAHIERGGVEPVIKVGNLETQRDMSDVRDIVRAYVALMERGAPSTVYNVASGSARSVRSILDALIERANVPVRVETDPARLRPSDVPIMIGDASRLHSATGWFPQIPFDRTLDDLLAYWRTVAP